MSAPPAAGGLPALAQPIAAPLTRAAIFLVVTLKPGVDDRATVRSFCGDLAALVRAVEFRDLEGGLSCVMGFGSDAWDRLFGPPRPAELHPFREIRAGARHAVSTPGDLLFHIRAEAHGSLLRAGHADHGAHRKCRFAGGRSARLPLLRRPRSHGLRRRDGKPQGGGGDRCRAHRRRGRCVLPRGSYVIVQKYLHDLEAWNALSTEAQERIIGRTKLSDIELDDSVKPTSAHNALTTIVENGKEIKILRDNMPFGRPAQGEFGTYFIGYSRSPRTIEQMLENMFIGRPPGNYDRLLDFSRAVTGNLFFVPSATFLETADRRSGSLARRRLIPLHPSHRCARVRSASVPSKETSDMNNLHRELAPISDSAWAQIEEETSRTLKRYLAGRRVVDVKGPAGSGLSAVGTGHLRTIAAPAKGIVARQREVKALVELRVPFELDRQAIDDVDRGANDSDWQPAKDAARQIAFAEDGAIFEGYAAAGIGGIRQGTSNPIMTLPADVREYPEAIAQGLSQLTSRRCQRPLLGAARRRRLHRTRRDQRPRIPGAGARQAAGQRSNHLGARHCRRFRADHSWRRFRPAHRPGRLHRLPQPHRYGCPPVPAGDVHFPPAHHRGCRRVGSSREGEDELTRDSNSSRVSYPQLENLTHTYKVRERENVRLDNGR